MVQLVRGWSRLLVGFLLEMIAALAPPLSTSPDDEPAGREPVAAVQEKQHTQIEPPPVVLQPMLHDPWPWFEETDNSSYHAAQEAVRRQNNFFIVTNGAHRKAMNDFEIATA
jgi:hypothetical protein